MRTTDVRVPLQRGDVRPDVRYFRPSEEPAPDGDAAMTRSVVDALVTQRLRLGRSRKWACEQMGCCIQTLWRIETYRKEPTVVQLQAYARAVGMQLEMAVTST